jgi:hypothetical protein
VGETEVSRETEVSCVAKINFFLLRVNHTKQKDFFAFLDNTIAQLAYLP